MVSEEDDRGKVVDIDSRGRSLHLRREEDRRRVREIARKVFEVREEMRKAAEEIEEGIDADNLAAFAVTLGMMCDELSFAV